MRRPSVWKTRGIASLTIVLGGVTILLITAALSRRERTEQVGRPAEAFTMIDEADAQALWDARTRKIAEEAVLVFQIIGLSTLGATWLSPTGAQAERRAAVILGSQVALGLAGILCAFHYSGFALFAGATVVVLFLGVIMNERVPAEADRPAARLASAPIRRSLHHDVLHAVMQTHVGIIPCHEVAS
jgi:hypothetical protein